MKNYILPLLFCFFTVLISNAQSIDYNTIIIPSSIKNISIEEKLIQLAWNNTPENRIEQNNLLIAEKNIKINTADWLGIITLSGNLNEFNIDPSSVPANRNYFYPRYNINATINLGMFVSTPINTNISKLNLQNQKERINSLKLQTRATVLTLYENYKLTKELLNIQTNYTNIVYSEFLIAEQDFKNGIISVENYNKKLNAYNDQLAEKLKSTKQFNISIIELESLIGIQIEDIL